MDSALHLALRDGATNCERNGATAVLTLRSGVQIIGKLQKDPGAFPSAAHLKTGRKVTAGYGDRFQEDGWATVLVEEIAAIEVRR